MITLVIRFEGLPLENRTLENLTLKELGAILTSYSENFVLLFETVRDINVDVGCTLFVAAMVRRG